MTDVITVSIVVPAYNEALRLPASLTRLVALLRDPTERYELVLVDDGSTDDTAAVAQQCLDGLPNASVVRLPWNLGKGAAVRSGVSVARGQVIVFMDADLAGDLNQLPALVARLEHAHIALGSRLKEGAEVVGRTAARSLGGAAYSRLARSVALVAVADTQCGFKAFHAPVAKLLFSLTKSNGFGFDVEVLALAELFGLRIDEFPIRWTAVDGGHASAARHGTGMLFDLLRARRHRVRARRGNGRPAIPPGPFTWVAGSAPSVDQGEPVQPRDPAGQVSVIDLDRPVALRSRHQVTAGAAE